MRGAGSGVLGVARGGGGLYLLDLFFSCQELSGCGAGMQLSAKGLAWRMGGPLVLSSISRRLEGL